MKRLFTLIIYVGRSFVRDRGVILSIVLLPLALMSTARISTTEDTLPLVLDSETFIADSVSVVLLLYAITSVVLVASITSFFLTYSVRDVVPRLRMSGYASWEIGVSFVVISATMNLIAVVFVGLYTNYYLDIEKIEGFFVGLLLVAVVMSLVGLIVGEFIESKTLGLYVIMTLAIIDVAFMENPVYSRRYNDGWMRIMPSHESLIVVLRSEFITSNQWFEGIGFILLYVLILAMVYISAKTVRKK